MKKNKFPKGWNEARVQAVLKHHENLTEEEEAAEIEAMFDHSNEVLIAIPRRLEPQIRKFIATHQTKPKTKSRKPRRVA